MKTNHQRGFKAQTHRRHGCQSWSNASELADQSVFAWIGNDFSGGRRGMARSVRGAKKFVRSRTRFHENAATRRLAQEALDD